MISRSFLQTPMRTPFDATFTACRQGVLRLRGCLAPRCIHSAQDDSFLIDSSANASWARHFFRKVFPSRFFDSINAILFAWPNAEILGYCAYAFSLQHSPYRRHFNSIPYSACFAFFCDTRSPCRELSPFLCLSFGVHSTRLSLGFRFPICSVIEK